MNLLISTLLLTISCSSHFYEADPHLSEPPPASHTVTFWNLENLFDFEDDPNNPGDDEFLPEKEWDEARYRRKLDNLAKAVKSMETDVLAVCEVENRRVLEDLIQHPLLIEDNWSILHTDSPDRRGIDLGLLYKAPFKIESGPTLHTIDLGEGNGTTRGVFEAELSISGVPITFLVNHWPSRYGGREKSTPRRILAASTVRKIVDDLLQKNPTKEIIVLGDLNDDPWDPSVREVLKAVRELRPVVHPSNISIKKGNTSTFSPYLWNPSWKFARSSDSGTSYYWTGWTWNCFDQIIVSPGLLDKSGVALVADSVSVHAPAFMIDTPQNASKPARFRKFRGKWEEGFSDHFAVKCKITVLNKDPLEPQEGE